MKHLLKQPPVIGLLTGLLIAVLFLVLGFWRTLLLLFLAGAGWWCGSYMQKHQLSPNDLILLIKSMLTK
ncbi:DUF2273 domain-containing protein [Periweissella fabaria]|uniref:DUF2273 domain-containing protein n=1 Tax=Periweissella fabaria TaxID=546157 RepID=UPI001E2FBF3B|nr:DUF2273 domain-containing protein [Periweissella fabaria]MCM0597291.1 DUF2273 domain-containing protein [Periweissella fabaria]